MPTTHLHVTATPGAAFVFYSKTASVILGFKGMLLTDMAIFFNLEEFAETVTYTATGGAGTDITAIIIRDTSYQEPYVRGKHTAHADLYVKKSEIAEPRFGDIFSADEEIWELDPNRGMFYEDDYMMVIGLERRFD
jgi:hypothetical protein